MYGIKKAVFAMVLILFAVSAAAREYHVSINGDDQQSGLVDQPLRTIMAAARLAQPGDTITVHEGIYREEIVPPRGGTSDDQRIVYQAAPGETAEIRGSEVVKDWKQDADGLWTVDVPNSLFGDYNPFAELVKGKWYKPLGRHHHTGCVYIDGEWLFEAAKKQDLIDQPNEKHKLAWFAEVTNEVTTIWAVFDGKNPNDALTEVNVRETVFYPRIPFRNYITVRGFTMRHAAPNYAYPLIEQRALIGVHWSKGWIIENNTISHSINAGISLGLSAGADYYEKHLPEGALTPEQFETLRSKENRKGVVGSHIVRNNEVSYCEQVGIVGIHGAIFSKILNNHVHHIHVQNRFTGAELAGIKFHFTVDTLIAGNRVHDTNRALWLDFHTQGTRVTQNLFYRNGDDCFLEANHGPAVIDNNLFLSRFFRNRSNGMAFAHNLFGGEYDVWLETRREPPYAAPHSTVIVGKQHVDKGEVRFYNNVFVGNGSHEPCPASKENMKDTSKGARYIGRGTFVYNEIPGSLQGAGNVFYYGAKPSEFESEYVVSLHNPKFNVVEEGDRVFLSFSVNKEHTALKTTTVTTELLGKATVPNQAYLDYDATPLVVANDYFGNPRNPNHPTPGPFDGLIEGEHRLQVWPVGPDRLNH